MSCHGPSAPRVEGIATKSRVVASCASKPASTASRIRCWISAFIGVSCPWAGVYRGAIKAHPACPWEGAAAFRIREHPIQFASGNLLSEPPVADKTNVLYLIIGVLVVAVGV